MDPQKFFLAKTLQGAVDAGVISLEDIYLHIPAEILSEHVPANILWNVIVEGMQRSELGFGGVDTTPPVGERLSEPPPADSSHDASANEKPTREPPPKEDAPEEDAPRTRSEFEVNEGEVDALFDQATDEEPVGEEVKFEVTDGLDDEMPPIPEEGIIVEEVDWDDEK